MFRFSAWAKTDWLTDWVPLGNFPLYHGQQQLDALSKAISFLCLSLYTDHMYIRAWRNFRDDATDFYCAPFPHCVSTDSSCILLMFEMKIREQGKTKISQYITISLITEQAKLQQNKIKETIFFSLLCTHDSARRQSYSLLLPWRVIGISPPPRDPVRCALHLQCLLISGPITWQENITSQPMMWIWQLTL